MRTDDDGELYVGLEGADGSAAIHRSMRGRGLGREIWRTSSHSWQIGSLAVGDPDDSGNGELFVGLNRSNGDAYLYRSRSGRYLGDQIWWGNGSTSNRQSLRGLAVTSPHGDGEASLFAGLRRSREEAALFRSETGLDLGERVWSFAEPSAARTLYWPYLGYGLDVGTTDELFATLPSFGELISSQ